MAHGRRESRYSQGSAVSVAARALHVESVEAQVFTALHWWDAKRLRLKPSAHPWIIQREAVPLAGPPPEWARHPLEPDASDSELPTPASRLRVIVATARVASNLGRYVHESGLFMGCRNVPIGVAERGGSLLRVDLRSQVPPNPVLSVDLRISGVLQYFLAVLAAQLGAGPDWTIPPSVRPSFDELIGDLDRAEARAHEALGLRLIDESCTQVLLALSKPGVSRSALEALGIDTRADAPPVNAEWGEAFRSAMHAAVLDDGPAGAAGARKLRELSREFSELHEEAKSALNAVCSRVEAWRMRFPFE